MAVPIYVHLILLAAIAGLIIFTCVRLLNWNKGREVDTSDIVESDYDVEISDNIFLLGSDALSGKRDDGRDTALLIGDDLVTFRLTEDEQSLSQLIGKELDMEVVDAGISGTTVAQMQAQPDMSYPQDYLSFRQLAQGLAEGDLSGQYAAVDALGDDAGRSALDRLAQVEMDALDMLIVAYDASDYLSQRIGMDPNDPENPITYMGAMAGGLRLIQESYPHVRIVVLSFPFCYAYAGDGSIVSGYMHNFGHGRISDYWQLLYDACESRSVSFIDNLYGTISESDTSRYLVDNVRVNEDCRAVIAGHLARALYGEGAR